MEGTTDTILPSYEDRNSVSVEPVFDMFLHRAPSSQEPEPQDYHGEQTESPNHDEDSSRDLSKTVSTLAASPDVVTSDIERPAKPTQGNERKPTDCSLSETLEERFSQVDIRQSVAEATDNRYSAIVDQGARVAYIPGRGRSVVVGGSGSSSQHHPDLELP